MAVGRLLGNVANVLQEPYGFTINHWNVMEVSCGFIGGFIYCFGMVGRAYPDPPEKENVAFTSVLGIVYVLGVIPLWHRLGRIRPDEKLEQWSSQLKGYGYDDPDKLAEMVLWLIDGVCVLGFIGAAVWLVIYFQRRQSWAALPVLWLSLTMLVFQNLNALYFFYPRVASQINMHSAFWIMFGLMVLYAVLARPRPAAEPATGEPRFNWAVCLGASLVCLALVIFAAGYVNGPKTMTSANTRWPVWVWTEGPFPRDTANP
jgi:hypothetical protein